MKTSKYSFKGPYPSRLFAFAEKESIAYMIILGLVISYLLFRFIVPLIALNTTTH